MTDRPTLYSVPPSYYSQVARLALAEKGVDARLVLVAAGPPTCESYAPWYMRLNPGGTVPTLVDGARVVADSRDILAYVDDTYPGPPLRPAAPELRAEVEAQVAAFYSLSFRELSYGSPKLARNGARANALRERNLRKRMRRHPELRELYEAKLRDIEGFTVNSQDPAKFAEHRARLDACLDDLERRLEGGREFIVGDAYTLADLVWTVAVARVTMLDLEPLAGRPALAAWYARMRERPSFTTANVWERFMPAQMAKMLVTKLWPYMLGIVAVLAALVWLLAWII